ncbi:TonB-dependent receptor [Pacificimonas sp. WHA3]|uniref:TonB-dependent receptor n=1 Tax=Pacificimonas pallii TaxID=2827236 RepID=A0ABS6SAH4_9SPHN|nr:TonB-dependent receptor [Pacificimonas pallii]MBV7255319.1 TonB-dependent receptor [Pacificimonas pallii]
MRSKSILALSACTTFFSADVAAAQESSLAAELESDGIPLIVVTARKKIETLQEAPISITAFTGDKLLREGITDFNEVAVRTPGLAYGNFGDEKLSPTSLRGVIGDAGSAGADPAVGFYLDEVFLGQGVGASVDFFDLERVEVLRGPQGTLFGRNTIGGVISYTTARPTPDFEAIGQLEYGNFNQLRAGLALSGPIVPDLLSARISAVTDRRDGISHNLLRGDDVNSKQAWSVRGQLLFDFGPDTQWRLSADYRKVDQDSLVFETLEYNPSTTFAAVADLFGVERNADPYDRDVYADILTEEEAEVWGITSNLSTSIGAINLDNVTAYRTHDYENRSDIDRSALRWLYDGDPEDVWRFSTETRISGNAGPVEWVAGVYYFEQKSKNLSFLEVGADLAAVQGVPELEGIRAGSRAEMKTTSYAGFASLTWELSDLIDITLGGRYTEEKKRIDYAQADPIALLGGDFAVQANDKWNQFTPNANIRFRFSPDVTAYLTVSKGFKSGGFNDALGDADGISFAPETLWNYEGGVKATLLGGLVQAETAIFYMDWTDIQLSADDPNTPVFDPLIINAGAAHSYGVEVDIRTRPTDRLTLGVNGSVLEAQYDEGTLPDGTELNHIPFAPEYTLNLNGEYRIPVSAMADLFVSGDYLLRGPSFLTNDTLPEGRVGSYALVNLRAGAELDGGRWRITGWVRNLTDKQVTQRLFDLFDQDVVGQRFIALNEPRTFGVTVDLRF